MNIEVNIFLAFDGDQSVAESLMADFANILLEHGYANDDSIDAPLVSLILMKPLEEKDMDVELSQSFYAVVPTKGIENGKDGNND